MAVLTGVLYPLQIDTTTGSIATASDGELLAGHVRSMLETEPQENPMRPGYGIPGALFNAQQNFTAYAAEVQRRLTREIPQATFAVTGRLDDNGEGILIVAWTADGLEQDPFEVTVN